MNKRKLIDTMIAVPATIIAAPLMAAIAVWIKLDSPGPVFFKQTRVGIHKNNFDILKFRTMRTDTPKDTPTHLLKNPEQYITKSGAFLRKTSLDELPQLFNILKGDMSIVGPRPALWNQYDLIAERDKYGANDVLPGLTGWAQIHGRDTISIEEKAKLDGYYIEHQSLWMDIKCILLTVISVLKHDGVQEGGTGALNQQPEKKSVNGNAAGDVSENASEGSAAGKEKMDVSSNGDKPLVSVIVATHHRKDELKRALASLANQTYKNIEVILVDDNAGSKWNRAVEHLVDGWKKKCGIPLKYIQNVSNQGSAASRNTGISASSGRYITFLDDDDKYCPAKIENQLNHMLRTHSDFSITDLALYNEEGKLEEKRIRYYLKHGRSLNEYVFDASESSDLLAYHLMYHLTGTDTLMFRKEYLEQIGGFPPIDIGDEFYLMRNAFSGGGKFSYLPVCEVKAMVHTRTYGLSSRERKIAGENALYEYKKNFFPKLKRSQVRKIRMRHHLVLAYAYLRSGDYGNFAVQGWEAVLAAPLACGQMVVKHQL